MIKLPFSKQLLVSLLVIALIGLAGLTRFWKVEYIPFADDGDELAYIFAGQSLAQYGVPISWSSFEYATTSWQQRIITTEVVNHNFEFTLVNPWFDHPPMIPLAMGHWVKLAGFEFPTIPTAVWYRLPMIAIACINLWLVFLIGKKIFDTESAVFSLVILGFSPAFLFAQRMVVSENFILLFLLSALYLYLEKRSLFWVGVASILAGFSKLTGLVVVPIIFMALANEKKYREAIIYAIGVTSIVLLMHFSYGQMIGPDHFFAALKNQSFRLLGWSNPSFLFSHPGFHTHAVLDFSYYTILLLGFLIFASKQRPETKLLISTMVWLLATVWATGAEQDMLGWYKIPLFAILGISAGYTIYAKQYLAAVLLVGLSVLNNIGLVRYPTHPLPDAPLLRFWISALVGAFLLLMYFKPVAKEKFQQGALVIVSVFYILQGIYAADSYFSALCRDRTCPTPTVTFMQKIREIL